MGVMEQKREAAAPGTAPAKARHERRVGPFVHNDDIGLGHARGVDALCRLHLRQRPDPVAQRRGALELHRFGGGGHLAGQILLHPGRPA